MLQRDTTVPVTLVIFDVLSIDGTVTMLMPYAERRGRLEELDLDGPAWCLSPTFEDGEALTVVARGLEGVVAKKTVDLQAGVIRVEASWDRYEGRIATKSRDARTVGIPSVLRTYLAEHLLRLGRSTGLIFGVSATEPFNYFGVTRRAKAAWEKAEVPGILLHECRHTFVTLMFAAGKSPEEIGELVGHTSTYVTARYRHLLEGHEVEAADALDPFLARVGTVAS